MNFKFASNFQPFYDSVMTLRYSYRTSPLQKELRCRDLAMAEVLLQALELLASNTC